MKKMSEYFFIRSKGGENLPGAIPCSFAERAKEHFKQTGAPYLQELKNAKHEIFIDHEQVLHLGEPWSHYPEVPTWRQFYTAAKCAHLIDRLKLGADDTKAGQLLGSLKRYEGSFTGADVLYVSLIEPITASWLQWALGEAGEPSNIRFI
jgi:hypothetical protein